MEGDLCQHIYILESRRVKFCRTSAEGREQILKRSLMNLVRAGAIDLNREPIQIRDLTLLKQISEG